MRRAAEVALRRAEAVLARDQNNSGVIAYSANALGALGERERAKARMSRALLIDPNNWNMRYNFACTLATYLGDKDAALEMMQPLFEGITEPLLRYLMDDPDFMSLHDDPGYQSMVAAAEARLAVAAPSQNKQPA